jgi:hypothetical protein
MGTTQDRIRTVRKKIERAKKHIGDLNAAVGAFFSSSPYEIGTKIDAQTARPIHYMTKVDLIPDEIPLILGDAIHNLRSSLDHLAYGLVEANGQIPTKRTYFPICENVSKYNSPDTIAKKSGMSVEAQNLIDSTQPYQGGNDLFWVLHHLNNIDKHHFILVAGSAVRSIDLGGFMTRDMVSKGLVPLGFPPQLLALSLFYKVEPQTCPLKVGDELFVGLPNAEPDQQLQFKFDIAFAEPQIVRGKAIVETVNQLANLIDGIFVQFERLL